MLRQSERSEHPRAWILLLQPLSMRSNTVLLYHFTARVDPRVPRRLRPFANRSDALVFWRKLQVRFSTQTVACVLMDNHVHLLLETRRPGLCLRNLAIELRAFARSYNHRNATTERAALRWQKITHPLPIDSPRTLRTVINYIHLNPCKAGMIRNPWLWEFSTLREWHGASLLDVRWVTQERNLRRFRERLLLGWAWETYRDHQLKDMTAYSQTLTSAHPLERKRLEDMSSQELKEILCRMLHVEKDELERRGLARDRYVQLRLLRGRALEDSIAQLERETGVMRKRIRILRGQSPCELRSVTELLSTSILASSWEVMHPRHSV